MSTIWTPGGERPVPPREDRPAPASGSPAGQDPAGREPGERKPDDLEADLAEVQRRLTETPAALVVTNHCVGLFQLAALHLGAEQPRLEEAQLAIDALAAVVETLGGRLGEHRQTLQDALAQIRLAFVQVRAGLDADGEAGSSS